MCRAWHILVAAVVLVAASMVGCGKRRPTQPMPPVVGSEPASRPPAPEPRQPEPAREANAPRERAAQEPGPAEAEVPKAEGVEKYAGLDGTVVKVETNRGDIVIELYDAQMPRTVSNFRRLVKKKFYDGLLWHRVEDWVVQTGDPTVTPERWDLWQRKREAALAAGRRPPPAIRLEDGGMWAPGGGGSGVTIKFETSPECTHDRGAVGMARSLDPDSASSQWYILKEAKHELDDEVRTKLSGGRERGYACFGHVVEGMDVVAKLKPGDQVLRARIIHEPRRKASR